MRIWSKMEMGGNAFPRVLQTVLFFDGNRPKMAHHISYARWWPIKRTPQENRQWRASIHALRVKKKVQISTVLQTLS